MKINGLARYSTCLFFVFFLLGVKDQAAAADILPEELTVWLCKVFRASEPGDAIRDFPPGSRDVEVQTGINPLTTTLGSRKQWTTRGGGWYVSYSRYDEDSDSHLHISGSAEKAIVFNSVHEAELWLSKYGEVYKDDDGSLVAILKSRGRRKLFTVDVTLDGFNHRIFLYWKEGYQGVGEVFCSR